MEQKTKQDHFEWSFSLLLEILDYPRGKGWKRQVKSSELMHTLFSKFKDEI